MVFIEPHLRVPQGDRRRHGRQGDLAPYLSRFKFHYVNFLDVLRQRAYQRTRTTEHSLIFIIRARVTHLDRGMV